MYEIKQLQQVLKSYLGNDRSVVSYRTKPLTDPGENYGSLILTVTVMVENNITKEQDVLNVVAKMCPLNSKMKEIFNVEVTFKKEVIMYTLISDKLRAFANEHNFTESLDFLCDYYGSRLSLDPKSTTVDDDATLLLENLKYSGFVMGNRFAGFNLETIKVILNDLAIFHSVPLALKLLKPTEFESVFMPHLEFGFGDPPERDENSKDREYGRLIRNAIEGNPKCAELSSKIIAAVESDVVNRKIMPPFSHPYGTICHLDLWINNIMVKYVDAKPVKSKLVDFQLYAYSSCAKDLVFLLFSSVQVSLLRKHFDELVTMYNNKMVETLQRFACNTENYSLQNLYEEMGKVLKDTENGHIIFMMFIILAEKGTMNDFKPDMVLEMEGSDTYKKRLAEIILMLAERQWL